MLVIHVQAGAGGCVEMLDHLGQLPPLGHPMGSGSYGNHRILLGIEALSVATDLASIKNAMSCGGLRLTSRPQEHNNALCTRT
jgi:hypothetical protein